MLVEDYMITAANYKRVKTTLKQYFEEPHKAARIIIMELDRLPVGETKSLHLSIHKIWKILQQSEGFKVDISHKMIKIVIKSKLLLSILIKVK